MNYLRSFIYTKPLEDLSSRFHFFFNKKNNKKLDIVLIIRESLRYDRLQINGYHRATNPYLSNYYNNGKNLVSFSHVKALATYTKLGVFKIMHHELYKTFSSFIKIFNHLDFNSFWITNQIRPRINNSTSQVIEEAEFLYAKQPGDETEDYDEILLPKIEEKIKTTKNPYNLFIIHLFGNHWDYEKRYPKSFTKWTPVCTKEERISGLRIKEHVNNSYDNTVLYNDFIINNILKKFKNRNAIIIYISDHGESLGENGFFQHAAPLYNAPKEQLDIPLIIYASDEFIQNNKEQWSAIKQNKDIYLDHSYIFIQYWIALG